MKATANIGNLKIVFLDMDLNYDNDGPEYTWHKEYAKHLQDFYKVPAPYITISLFERGAYYDAPNREIVTGIRSNLSQNSFSRTFDKFNCRDIQVHPFALAHEYQHHTQCLQGRLAPIYGNPHYIRWEGKVVPAIDGFKNWIDYSNQPWEVEANNFAIDFCRKYGYTV